MSNSECRARLVTSRVALESGAKWTHRPAARRTCWKALLEPREIPRSMTEIKQRPQSRWVAQRGATGDWVQVPGSVLWIPQPDSASARGGAAPGMELVRCSLVLLRASRGKAHCGWHGVVGQRCCTGWHVLCNPVVNCAPACSLLLGRLSGQAPFFSKFSTLIIECFHYILLLILKEMFSAI